MSDNVIIPCCAGDDGRCGAHAPDFAHTAACLAEHEAALQSRRASRQALSAVQDRLRSDRGKIEDTIDALARAVDDILALLIEQAPCDHTHYHTLTMDQLYRKKGVPMVCRFCQQPVEHR
jgi:hypothetical protein